MKFKYAHTIQNQVKTMMQALNQRVGELGCLKLIKSDTSSTGLDEITFSSKAGASTSFPSLMVLKERMVVLSISRQRQVDYSTTMENSSMNQILTSPWRKQISSPSPLPLSMFLARKLFPSLSSPSSLLTFVSTFWASNKDFSSYIPHSYDLLTF